MINRDLVLEAEHAATLGDQSLAASKLRSHLALHPDDGPARLQLGRLLITLAELVSARHVVRPLDHSENDLWAAAANRLLATLDEREGALTSAQIRWERALGDDIDDAEARAHLRALAPQQQEDDRWPSNLALATLASPEGVRLSRFRLVRELGRGATAAVYLVRDERLDLPLALKVLHPQLAAASRAAARERFFAEARLAARLRHPGVVAIYSVDEIARCLAMEYVAGGTLRDCLRSRQTPGIDAAEVVAIARSLLDALAYVHDAGIIHGDLKPSNILLRGPTEIVLCDFGVAEFAAAATAADDRPAGTPLYLAPEQFHGAPPSPRTDLYAVGVILWELIRGQPARRHSDLLSGAPMEAAPLPADALVSLGQAGVRLASVIAALMSTDSPGRPPSAHAARAALD